MRKNRLRALLLSAIMVATYLQFNIVFADLTEGNTGKVWHDWDFENGVNVKGWLNSGSDPRVTVNHEKYGKGMALTSGKIAKVFYNPGETINSGVVNISFDFMGDSERGNEILSFNSDGGEDGRKYVFFMDGEDKFKMGKDSLAQWGDSTKVKTFEFGKLYHIDLVFDFERLEYKSYANGELIGTSKLSAENNIQNTYWYFDNSYFFDNFRMSQMSDTSYEVQKQYWTGDYLEVLLSEGAGEAEHSLAVSDFLVTDAKTGTVVTPKAVEIVGRRVIFSGLNKTSEYNITFPINFKNVRGTQLLNKERKTNLRLTRDTSGTELTEDMKKTLVPGDKVYAELTYKNTTGKSENFVVFGASYAGGKMTDVGYKKITSDGKDEKTLKEYIEIDVTDTTDLRFKTFAWDSVSDLTPDVKINTEYQLLGEEYTRFLGRGEKKGNGRTFNWPNAGIEFEFSGDKAEVFASASNNDSSQTNGNYFTMAVYDEDRLIRTERIKLVSGWNRIYESEPGDPDLKTIMLVRSSEACRGTVALSKLRCDLSPEPTKPRERLIEFIGDSYTAGYGNLDKLLKIGYYCAKNTDNWNSYTGMVARHFGVDNTVIAHQGKGVYANRSLSDLNGNMAEQFNYAEILATADNMSTKAHHDFSEYQPHLVSVWLGTNDSAAPVDKETFKAAYEDLLDNIRSKYPDAAVLCVAINNSTYHSTINSIVSERGAENDYYMLTLNPFTSSTLGHPDVEEDARIAEQFINKINSIENVWK